MTLNYAVLGGRLLLRIFLFGVKNLGLRTAEGPFVGLRLVVNHMRACED